MSTTYTKLQIRDALATLHGDILILGQQIGSSGASATAIPNSDMFGGRAVSSSLYDGCVVRVTSGARAGERSNVDFNDPVNGILNCNPGFTGALAANDTFEIWKNGVDPDFVDRMIDDCLQQVCSTWRQYPITVIPDGDMDLSDVTHWTAVGGATRAKAYQGFPQVVNRRVLSVVHTTAASDYVKSDTIDVNPGELYFAEVPVQCYVTATSAPSVATLQPYDESNTANITLSGIRQSHTGRGMGRISILFQVPQNCYRIHFRLLSSVDASTSKWGAICCIQRQSYEFTLPDRIRTRKRVAQIFQTGSVINDSTFVNRHRFKLSPWLGVERVQVGSNVVLWFNPPLSNVACYYWERGYFDRLQTDYFTPSGRSAGDAATTDCPVEYIAAAVMERILKSLVDKDGEQWQDDWVRASSWLDHQETDFGAEPQIVHEQTSPVVIPFRKV